MGLMASICSKERPQNYLRALIVYKRLYFVLDFNVLWAGSKRREELQHIHLALARHSHSGLSLRNKHGLRRPQ